jgi:hypothetical protein
MTRALLASIVAGTALLAVPAAGAKDFHPGDLRVCNAKRCVAITSRAVLPQLGSFYYGNYGLTPMQRPAFGAFGVRYYQLRFRNGYVSGIVAGARLDRFLSYGVNLGRFVRNRWYALPRRLSAELRRVTAGLSPLRLTHAALARSR